MPDFASKGIDGGRQGPDNARQGPDNARQGPDNARQGLDNARQGPDNARQGPDNAGQGPDNAGQGPDNAGQGPDNAGQGPENARQRPDKARQRPDKARQGPDNARQGPDNARQGPDNARQGSDNARQGPDNARQGSDNARQGPDNARQGPDNARQGPDNARQGADNANNVSGNSKNKKKRRQRKKNKGKKDTEDQKDPSDPQNIQAAGDRDSGSRKGGPRTNKKKRSGRRGWDRYYGRFCCRICRRRWDSALVFTIAGTRRVLWKQRCKNCTEDDAWTNPFDLELLRCSVCGSQVCECTCEECNNLKHRRYVTTKIQTPDGDVEERTVDDRFEYCKCPENKRKSKSWVGANIDAKKPHLALLCQKCLKGFPCNQARLAEDGDEAYSGDNEP